MGPILRDAIITTYKKALPSKLAISRGPGRVHMSTGTETKHYHHGRFTLTGGVLPNAITAYRVYGDPKNPCVVFPTCYGGRLDSE